MDEAVTKIPLDKIRRLSRRRGERVLVCLVGVQTNQFCRGADIALALRQEGVGIIALREDEGKAIEFIIQVDVASYENPGFIEKAVRAGCCSVFIGMESLNPRKPRARPRTGCRNTRSALRRGTMRGYLPGNFEIIRCVFRTVPRRLRSAPWLERPRT